MNARPEIPTAWHQTVTGRAIDLLNPDPATIDFTVDVPDALARIARFNGGLHLGPFSVGQHSIHGADALKAQTGRDDIAFAFLLHDGHEYVLGDMTSPVATMFVELARKEFNAKTATLIRDLFDLAKAQLDAAIFKAAGVKWPLPEDVTSEIRIMDVRMLRTERDHLHRRPPMRWHTAVENALPVRFPFGSLKIWPWPKVADEWRQRFELYRPKPQVRPFLNLKGN